MDVNFAARLDHLVVAAKTLELGVGYIEELLGVSMLAGGQHVKMGTHNALLGLGPELYLEVIAIDEELPAPQRPRWFAMDEKLTRLQLERGPLLHHWVAAVDDLTPWQAEIESIFGPITTMSRGDLSWQITIPESGGLPGLGCLPSLISWPEGVHPALKLPDSGWRLKKIKVTHPQAIDYSLVLSRIEPKAAISWQTAAESRLQAVLTKNGSDIVLA